MLEKKSKWQTDIEIFSKINQIIIIEGNIFDRYEYGSCILDLKDYLYSFYRDMGYEGISVYDPVMKGFYCRKEKNEPISLVKFGQACGAIDLNKQINTSAIKDSEGNFCISSLFKGPRATAPFYIKKAMSQQTIPCVVIMDLASHLINSSANLSSDENDAFTAMLKAGLEAQTAINSRKEFIKNITLYIVNKVNDLPTWFYLNNPVVKIVHIDTPDSSERYFMVNDQNFRGFFDKEIFDNDFPLYENNQEELKKIKDKFVGKTEGFSFLELNSLKNLCSFNKFRISQLPTVVDFYRFGVSENPWESPNLKEKVKNFDITKRVKGQPLATRKCMAVVKRSISGLSGIQHSSSHSKPRGVLFFAGPTGTGKTETAKALSELIFGDEKNCIRFDMSEFSQPHSDQRLLGAPPGYVGYEAGGQLTNAVREHPFSILLFDEIEKAHPSILDKFLQILEDGRMTDGQGKTVYFSECIIIFTSNLGISVVDEDNPNGPRKMLVTPALEYCDVVKNVRNGVENYFKYQLGRPEILNRIGDNIVVFDFIREKTALQILTSQIDSIINNLKVEKNIVLEINNSAIDYLYKKSLNNLENGGRGIGNIVESLLVNPLSEYIFDNNIESGSSIFVKDITESEGGVRLIC